MKKPEIAKRLARRSGVSAGEAADRLDGVVRDILAKVRKGQEAGLPGLGRFRRGPGGAVTFERDGGERD
jgi:nucleoid DNA-binding protein